MKNYAKPGEVLYHVGLSVEMLQGAKYALVPGDPGRVEGLAKALDKKAVFLASHREFTSWLARVKGEPVLVMSSGMGGPNITFVVEKACVRMDGASRAYAPIEYPAVADLDVTIALRDAARELKVPFGMGIGVTTDSFWPGQERYDSLNGYVLRRLQGSLKEWQALGCTNFEMEASTLLTLCSVHGLRAGAICGVVAKRTDSESVAPPGVYKKAEQRFQKVAKRALEKLIAADKA